MRVFVGVTSMVELSHRRLFEQDTIGRPWGRTARGMRSSANNANNTQSCALRGVAVDLQPIAFSHMGDWHPRSVSLAVRQMKYLVVAIEYFTKWIEVELVAQIIAHKLQHFMWENIVCRFGIPKHLVSDNGTQITSQQLGKLCTELGIKQVFASVEHPKTNGQVKYANWVLLRGLKRRLKKAKGTWANEVPRIVWAYHTTP